MESRLVVLVVLGALGCRPQQSPAPQHPSIHQGVYTITIKSATIAPRRPDGTPWHVSQPDKSALVVAVAAGVAVGNPDLGMKVGEAISEKGGDPLAPIPFVRVKLAGTTWTIAPVGRSYSPAWNESIEINARTLTGDEQVVIQVLDAVDESLLAQGQLRLSQLVARSGQTLTNLQGSVSTLDLEAALHNWLDQVDVETVGGGD